MKVQTLVLALIHLTITRCHLLIPEFSSVEHINEAEDPLQVHHACALKDGKSLIHRGISAANYGLLASAINTLEQRLLKLQELAQKNSPADLKKDSDKNSNEGCRPPFAFVEGSCLLLELSQKLTWNKARVYCQERGADLAVFKDANTFEAIIKHIKSMNSAQTQAHVWIGGTDQQQEDHWLWIDGDPMPRGSPYWGSIDGYKIEPGGGTGQNCAFLYHTDHYYVHDLHCEASGKWLSAPLCQYFP